MRKVIIDINEMSDSKEIYDSRPRPIISIFIYTLVLILIASIAFSFIGKIEVVSRTSGIIRPNEDVSNVSSLIGGQVTGVFYSNGQVVKEGDILLTIDTSEKEILRDSLEEAKENYENQILMLDKFILGIKAKENPFDSNVNSSEYAYYIQYENYELSIQNEVDSYEYDVNTTNANIESLTARKEELQSRLEGLNSVRNSIQEGTNLTEANTEYESRYLLYASTVSSLQIDYETQRNKIENGDETNSNLYYLEYYQAELIECTYLIESIEAGESVFPANDNSIYKYLFDDYLNKLLEKELMLESSILTYEYYLNGGASTDIISDLLAYDETMLEGYNLFRSSVENDMNLFDPNRDSIYYSSLYESYKANYDALVLIKDEASAHYNEVLASSDSTPDDINAALREMEEANNACIEYKASTLSEIDNQILQINSLIAQKELSFNTFSSELNVDSARIQMESAENALVAHKTNALLEYANTKAELENKISELSTAISAPEDKATLLTNLEATYQTSLDKYKLQTIAEIDGTIQSLELELMSTESNLRLYEIMSDMYSDGVSESGEPLVISLSEVSQISSILSRRENLDAQIIELDTNIAQARSQISQGTIVAKKDGIINSISTFMRGDTITAGTVFATIIPFDGSEFKVQLFVNNSDIANIKVGDKIKYNIGALPSNQYGFVEGKVTYVSRDVLIEDGQYSGYYLVEGSIENIKLTDKDGNIGEVSIGMQVEAKVVIERKAIVWYLLEKINLF